MGGACGSPLCFPLSFYENLKLPQTIKAKTALKWYKGMKWYWEPLCEDSQVLGMLLYPRSRLEGPRTVSPSHDLL